MWLTVCLSVLFIVTFNQFQTLQNRPHVLAQYVLTIDCEPEDGPA